MERKNFINFSSGKVGNQLKMTKHISNIKSGKSVEEVRLTQHILAFRSLEVGEF